MLRYDPLADKWEILLKLLTVPRNGHTVAFNVVPKSLELPRQQINGRLRVHDALVAFDSLHSNFQFYAA